MSLMNSWYLWDLKERKFYFKKEKTPLVLPSGFKKKKVRNKRESYGHMKRWFIV